MVSDAYRILRGDDWAAGLRACLPAATADMPGWMEHNTRLLKRDRYSAVGLLSVQGQLCCLKHYSAKSAWQNMGFRFAISRGVRSFDAAADLLQAGLKVPAPRACLWRPGAMFLLSQGVADSSDLRALWLAGPAVDAAGRYLRTAGETLAALHLAGFAHGDCKWSNLLWRRETCYLVDLEDAGRVRAPGGQQPALHARQLRDIARFTADAEALAVSPGQYQNFLASYCLAIHCTPAQLRDQVQQPLRLIRQRHRRKSGISHPALL